MMLVDCIRHALIRALAGHAYMWIPHCDEREELADALTVRVLDAVGGPPDGPCAVCGNYDLLDLTPTGEHPQPLRDWVIEECGCGAKRIAEHELPEDVEKPEAEDVRVIAATPWRAV